MKRNRRIIDPIAQRASRTGKTNAMLADDLRKMGAPQERIDQILNGEIMTDETTRIGMDPSEAEGTVVEVDQDAEIERLSLLLRSRDHRIQDLEYINEGMQDAARMTTAATILPGLINANSYPTYRVETGMEQPTAPESGTEFLASLVKQAVDLADEVVSRYGTIMHEKALEYRRLLSQRDQENSGEVAN